MKLAKLMDLNLKLKTTPNLCLPPAAGLAIRQTKTYL